MIFLIGCLVGLSVGFTFGAITIGILAQQKAVEEADRVHQWISKQ